MFSLNEQEDIINVFLDVIEVMKNTCQSLKFDSINIAFKRSILPENIIGKIPELDDNTVHEQYGELGIFFTSYTQTKNKPTILGSLEGTKFTHMKKHEMTQEEFLVCFSWDIEIPLQP